MDRNNGIVWMVAAGILGLTICSITDSGGSIKFHKDKDAIDISTNNNSDETENVTE